MPKKMTWDDNVEVEEITSKKDTKEVKAENFEIGSIVKIPIEQIEMGDNIRNTNINDESNFIELGESIKDKGLIEPITVYPKDGKYIIKCGSRRYRACIYAGLDTIDCIISKEFEDEKDRIIIQAIENEHREQMSAREREKYMKQLMDLGMSQVEIAKALHKGKGWVNEALTAYNTIQSIGNTLPKEMLEEGSTRDIWNASRLNPSELEKAITEGKEKGGSKKDYTDSIKNAIKNKKEPQAAESEEDDISDVDYDNPEENSKINEDFNIEFDVETNTDNSVSFDDTEENQNSSDKSYTLGLHLTFEINEDKKTMHFKGNKDDFETDFENVMLRQAQNYYIGKGYTVD